MNYDSGIKKYISFYFFDGFFKALKNPKS